MQSVSVVFLGTCACDFSPKLKTEYKDVFDPDARRSASMLLDGSILVDCGPHTLDALRIGGIDPSSVTDLLLTHLHDDHFVPENVALLAASREIPLRLWVREDAELSPIPHTVIRRMKPYTRYEAEGGFAVTGLLANHDGDAHPQHFLLERAGKKIFYGCDGAWLLAPTYYHLRNAHLDLAVFDCTMGDYTGDYRIGEHNGIPMLRLLLPSLRGFGTLDEHTKVYFSHLAPSLHKPHAETEAIAREMGAHVAHDGLRITV